MLVFNFVARFLVETQNESIFAGSALILALVELAVLDLRVNLGAGVVLEEVTWVASGAILVEVVDQAILNQLRGGDLDALFGRVFEVESRLANQTLPQKVDFQAVVSRLLRALVLFQNEHVGRVANHALLRGGAFQTTFLAKALTLIHMNEQNEYNYFHYNFRK